MFRGLAPPPKLTVDEWADEKRVLSPESCAAPGKWYTDRVPYLREIMRCMTDSTVESVSWMKSAQVAATEAILNFIGYIIDQDPGPILVVMPNLQSEAKQFSRNRLEPMLRDTPCLNGKTKAYRSRSKDPDNTTLEKRFPGGYLAIVGAKSSSSLSSRPIRYILMDEIDRYPRDIDGEGDPVALAEKRASTFHNRKKIKFSTPTIDKASAIQREWERSDQRHYYVPCPKCKKKQRLYFTVKFEESAGGEKKIGGLKWDKGTKGEHRTETVYYECEHCAYRITEDKKELMLERGEWRASKPFSGHAGFHINEVYSPWVQWEEMAKDFLEIKHSRDKARMKTFVNLRLGEPFMEEGQKVEHHEVMKRRERWEAAPNQILVLTAAVDVQDNRLEYIIYGWGHSNERWCLDYGVFMGDTLKEPKKTTNGLWIDDQENVWCQMKTYLGTHREKRADGINLKIQMTACDSGHRTTQVYEFCKQCRFDGVKVFAIKGEDGERTPAIKAAKNRKMFWVGVDGIKKEIYDWLDLKEPGPGFIHFPIKDGFDIDFFEQLTSEERVRKFKNNFPVYYWKKKNAWARNEVLDLTVYAQAALLMLKPNFEALEKNLQLQKELGAKPEKEPEKAEPIKIKNPMKKTPTRRSTWATRWKN